MSGKENSGKNHRADNQIDPYQSLANAIILQAIRDYRNASEDLADNPKSTTARHRCDECMKFFRSRWFGVLTDVRPEILIERLHEEKKYMMARTALKKLYESIALRRAVLRCGRYGNQ